MSVETPDIAVDAPPVGYYVERFEARHLSRFVMQSAQASEADYDPEYWAAVAQLGIGFTGFRDGLCLGCCGLLPHRDGRANAWARISDRVGPHEMLWITRRIIDFFTEPANAHRRVELTTDARFPAAWRWARLLGFKRESRLEAYMPDGGDAFMWVRINRNWRAGANQ